MRYILSIFSQCLVLNALEQDQWLKISLEGWAHAVLELAFVIKNGPWMDFNAALPTFVWLETQEGFSLAFCSSLVLFFPTLIFILKFVFIFLEGHFKHKKIE